MVIGGVLEFILGNTFPSVVFSMFGAFWLSYAATLQPFYHAAIAYDPTHPNKASSNPEFADSFAFFMIYMGVLCFIFLICSLRTNLVFFLIFACLVPAFACLAASFWHHANGKADQAVTLQHAGAGLAYAVCCLGWYLFTVQLLAAVDFPIDLPVVDLSTIVKGGSQRKKQKNQHRQDEADAEKGFGKRLRFWKKE
jgi:succinate-acetate transporter protein